MVIAGIFGIWFGVFIELTGLFRASDILPNNLYGLSGSILFVLGLAAISFGRTGKAEVEY